MAAYQKFGQEHAAAIRGGAVLHPTATATTVRVTGARGGDVVTGDGPYEARPGRARAIPDGDGLPVGGRPERYDEDDAVKPW